jgi:SAM-dependent methyltransferase
LQNIKLNLGASPIWRNEDWHILDHKLKKTQGKKIAGDAENISLKSSSCSVVFSSHVFEHIPNIRLPLILAEINRVLKKGGTLRILTPDLEKICKAYVKKDKNFLKKAIAEDENIRKDLGYGGALMNFIVSPGQDTVLVDRSLKNFISGMAHVYLYDYEMLSKILRDCGFKTRKAKFNDSQIKEMREPLHVNGLKKKWSNFNQKFYKKNKLKHYYKNGKYTINFTVNGFDRDPVTSLIIEAKKISNVSKNSLNKKYNESKLNYNRYAFSLLQDKEFVKRLKKLKIKY